MTICGRSTLISLRCVAVRPGGAAWGDDLCGGDRGDEEDAEGAGAAGPCSPLFTLQTGSLSLALSLPFHGLSTASEHLSSTPQVLVLESDARTIKLKDDPQDGDVRRPVNPLRRHDCRREGLSLFVGPLRVSVSALKSSLHACP